VPGSLVGVVLAILEASVRSVEIVLGLVVLGVVVATLAARLKAPAPSLLVIAGVVVGLLPGLPRIAVTPETISLIVLPPLLYAASVDVAMPELRKVIGAVSALAIGLVAVSAVAVAFVVHAMIPDIPLAAGFVLGAVIASTDPVAVSALARRLRLPPRLLALVQGESLLNDATSLVLFRVAVTAAAAGAVTVGGAAAQFVRLGAGGAVVGLGLAYLIAQLRRRTDDAVLETSIALLTPYTVYVVAEAFGTSGVTAVVVAGLYLGQRGVQLSRGSVRLRIDGVYDVVVFLLESVVFAVIGLELPTLVREMAAAERDFAGTAVAVTFVALLTRLLWIYPAGYLPRLFGRTEAADAPAPTWRVLAVATWAGTRGVVPLAAALSIPLTVDSGAPFPHRDLLIVLAISCIILTLVVQGLTLEPLVRRLGVTEDRTRAREEEDVARHAVATAALERLDELLDLDAAPPAVLERLRQGLEARLGRTRAQLDAGPVLESAEPRTGPTYRRLRLDLLAVESARLMALRDEGRISEDTRRKVQRSLDLEDAGLSEPAE